jgi:hypothetical protein
MVFYKYSYLMSTQRDGPRKFYYFISLADLSFIIILTFDDIQSVPRVIMQGRVMQ